MKMKNLISFLSLIIIFQSCEDPDNTVNFVLDNYETGAVLRTITTSGSYNYYDQSTSVFTATIEEHDEENGGRVKKPVTVKEITPKGRKGVLIFKGKAKDYKNVGKSK